MVKVRDFGYLSKNLQRVPSKEDQKSQRFKKALSNLTTPEQPERLSRVQLPKALLNLVGE
jgi:DNA-binding TFAR19-related protein (PDSD5 family)